MNKYVKEMVEAVLVGVTLVTALVGCCLRDFNENDGARSAGRPKAAVLCNDRACSNVAGAGR